LQKELYNISIIHGHPDLSLILRITNFDQFCLTKFVEHIFFCGG
jgi:hypothetical protein